MRRRRWGLRAGLCAGLTAIVAAVGLWAGPGLARAASCTDSWLNPVSGAWSAGANWSTGSPPASGDVACITVPGTYTVTLTPYTPPGQNTRPQGGDTIANLVLGGGSSGTQTLDVSGQTWTDSGGTAHQYTELIVTGTSSIAANGALVLDATGSGTTSGGDASFDGGTVANAGTISTQVEDSSWEAKMGDGLITNSGTIDVNSGTLVLPTADEGGSGSTAGFSLDNTGTINVAASAEVDVDQVPGAGTSTFTQDGTIANGGTFVAANGGGGLSWDENGGGETGNPIGLQSGILLDDTAGTGSFVFNGGGGGIEGTIPSGQSVDLQGVSSVTSMNETSNTTVYDLQGKTLTNDGTLGVEATNTGSAEPLGATAAVQDGGIANAGTLNLTVDPGSQYVDQLDVGFTNEHGANVEVSGGEAIVDGGGTLANDGTITLAPGANLLPEANPFLSGPETVDLNADGTVIPQIASASSFGTLTLGGHAGFVLGGTVAPQLLGGYVPPVGQGFGIFPTAGATITGTFGAVTGGFSASYANESANGVPLAYGGAPSATATAPPPASSAPVPGPAGPTTFGATSPATPRVTAVRSADGQVIVSLTCSATTTCAHAEVVVSVTERIRNNRVVAVAAIADANTKKPRTTTRTVRIATATASVAAHETRTLRLSLTGAGRRLLAAHHTLEAAVSITVGRRTLKRTTIRLTIAKPVRKKTIR